MFGLYRGIELGANNAIVQFASHWAANSGLSSCRAQQVSCGYKEIPRMTEPKIAQKGPYPVELEAGKSYFWCTCGRSINQPFCDASHRGTGFAPVKFEVAETKTAYLCGCKHTANPVFCDGSHSKL
jgi:CDGSH-type Zn-finger protein